MEINKNYIDECLEEFDEKFPAENEIGHLREATGEKTLLFASHWAVKSFLKQKLQQVEEHETENGYCCACEYDIACMNEKIEIAVQKKVEEIKKSKTKIVGILFNAQNSPIEYSLQEIADKIIKKIKN